MANVVVLKGDPIQKEGIASEAITPGMLIEYGGSDDFQKHSSAGGSATPMFADRNAQWGQGIDDDIPAGDTLQAKEGGTGDEFNALLAVGENVSKGDVLESAGDGTLQAYTAQSVDESGTATYDIADEVAVVRAIEAVDNSGGSEAARIKVEVI